MPDTSKLQDFEKRQEQLQKQLDQMQSSLDRHTTLDGAAVFEKNCHSIAEIQTDTSAGSGFLISQKGYLLTNAHVVMHNGKIEPNIVVRLANEQVSASVVAIGSPSSKQELDLAVLKLSRLPKAAKPVQIGDYSKVKIGATVFASGNSRGLGTCITSGIVSDINRETTSGHKLLMTDCAINHGNSGGPLFNDKGEVIAVVVSMASASQGAYVDGMKYAIPISDAMAFLKHGAPDVPVSANVDGAFKGLNIPKTTAKNPFSPPEVTTRPSIAPCPKCGSTGTIIKQGQFGERFVCDDPDCNVGK